MDVKNENVTNTDANDNQIDIDNDIVEETKEIIAEENSQASEETVVEEDVQESEETVAEEETQESEENEATEDTHVNEDEDKDKKAVVAKQKSSKFKAFVKKYKIAIIIIAAVILVAASITTAVAIVNAPKIFVRTAEDFLKDTSKKKVYVLQKDITVYGDLTLDSKLDINLNNKSLTVKGDFSRSFANSATTNIGTIKKKQFISGGNLSATNLVFNAPASTINIYSDLTIDGGEITVKEINFYSNLKINNNGYIDFNSTDINVHKNIDGTAQLNNCYLYILPDGKVDGVVADIYSNINILGTVTNTISGGNEVSVLQNAICGAVDGAIVLYYQQETALIDSIINIKTMHFVNQLTTPTALIIEQVGTTFKCVSTVVKNADIYIFTIKHGDALIKTLESSSNIIDITEYIKSPKTYSISVQASSSDTKVNLPSQLFTIDYVYSIKLTSPALSINDSTEKIMLTFNSIDFASIYIVDINGTQKEVDAKDSGNINIDLTPYIENVGVYYIKVVASNPSNTSFTDSDATMISYIKEQKLAQPVVTVEESENQITLSWEKIENALNYTIQYDGKIIVTKNNSVSFDKSSLKIDNNIFYITAQGHGYYQTSTKTTASFYYGLR